MVLKFKANYDIIIPKEETFEIKVSLEELSEVINEDIPRDKHDLRNGLYEFIDQRNYLKPFIKLNNNEDLYDDPNFQILNFEKLYPLLEHLIVPTTCCDKASYNANYCEVCGKKLK